MSLSSLGSRPPSRALPFSLGEAFVLLLLSALAFTALRPLLTAWREDETLSHGPLLAVGAVALLWLRRADLRAWNRAAWGGLALLVVASLLHLAAIWADIAFLKPFSFLMIAVGAVWFLGGKQAMQAAAGALGLLAFGIPWPTTLVVAITFPLQMTSSAYAALFAGMLGLQIQQRGVHLSVIGADGETPTYSMLVAQECSGLTSLMVLLAFGYLIAYFTPVRAWARLFLLAAVVPLTLLANAVRLTIILLAGGLYSASVAQWVHDHEQPVLIFLCSFGLLGLRHLLLSWKAAQQPSLAVAEETPA